MDFRFLGCARKDMVGAQKDMVGEWKDGVGRGYGRVLAQEDVVGAQEGAAGAAILYWVECRRRERLEFLDSLPFPPVSSRLGGASRAPSAGSARTEVRHSVFAGDRLGELAGGAAGLEGFLVTTWHGPQWLVLIWSRPDNGART